MGVNTREENTVKLMEFYSKISLQKILFVAVKIN